MISIKKNTLSKFYRLAVLVLLLTAGCQQNGDNTSNEKIQREIEPSLQMAAEGLNDLLPQHLGSNTTLDSIGVKPSRLFYNYSIDNISKIEFENENLSDSLYAAAVDRIPCTLWLPVYMQRVQVTFTYYSNDHQELIQFSRTQDACQ